MKRYNYRDKRIAKQIFNELYLIVSFELRDAIFENVVITDVVVTPDLGLARVYIISNNKNIQPYILKEKLDKAKGFIKMKLIERLYMKRMPMIEFIVDQNILQAEKIEKLIDELRKE
ncbi:MAG: 30S ribosome-binding factor RbfA [Deferribacterota bacterium]|nr:30S ribosome-binding factor RbfA [Deferribacterota bacterium]